MPSEWQVVPSSLNPPVTHSQRLSMVRYTTDTAAEIRTQLVANMLTTVTIRSPYVITTATVNYRYNNNYYYYYCCYYYYNYYYYYYYY